mgnify:CR=1 FL=1
MEGKAKTEQHAECIEYISIAGQFLTQYYDYASPYRSPGVLYVRQHALQHLAVILMNDCIITQMTFTFGALLGQNMTTMRLTTFKSAVTGLAKIRC